VVAFLRLLARHLRGKVIVLWDRGRSHRAKEVQRFLARHHSRITVEWFPGYSPDLNPQEHAWAYLKHHRVPNHGFRDTQRLHCRLAYEVTRLRRRQDLLRSFVHASELPFKI